MATTKKRRRDNGSGSVYRRASDSRIWWFSFHDAAGKRPREVAAVVEFSYITGWRVASEVPPMQWKQVDWKGGDVRLDAGTTKNRDARVIYMNDALRRLLEARYAQHHQLAKAGQIEPHVFVKMVEDKRGGEKFPKPIGSFKRADARAQGGRRAGEEAP